ncbi:hypothetical protein G3I40_20595 [Streptomyces sp. SID14478]|uniref:hypothetical protein n=1 Tax=Streptomyces sp. SID14478 TaxID=2706073 RepID=UPI0013D94300|nr:hypothetical protein [Streptomyces sp. SID14478]NEB77593.1 hypothetical protein [Streptomyces sp. SID14478]
MERSGEFSGGGRTDKCAQVRDGAIERRTQVLRPCNRDNDLQLFRVSKDPVTRGKNEDVIWGAISSWQDSLHAAAWSGAAVA